MCDGSHEEAIIKGSHISEGQLLKDLHVLGHIGHVGFLEIFINCFSRDADKTDTLVANALEDSSLKDHRVYS